MGDVVGADHDDDDVGAPLLEQRVDLRVQVQTLGADPRRGHDVDRPFGADGQTVREPGRRSLDGLVDAEPGGTRVAQYAEQHGLGRGIGGRGHVDVVGLGWVALGRADDATGRLGLGEQDADEGGADADEAARRTRLPRRPCGLVTRGSSSATPSLRASRRLGRRGESSRP